MIKDYEVIDGEHGIIREIKERKYNYPRTLFAKSLTESIKELSFEFSEAIEEVNMKLKEYLEHKKEVEQSARKRKNKRRTHKRTSNRKS